MTTTAKLLELYDKATIVAGGSERALFCLLKEYESQLPIIDERFHKAFRQTDVTNSGLVDLAIWHLLKNAPLFWKCFDDATKQEPQG